MEPEIVDEGELARLWHVIPDVRVQESGAKIAQSEAIAVAVTTAAMPAIKAPAKSSSPSEKIAKQTYTLPAGGRASEAKPDAFEEAAIAALRVQLISASKPVPNAKG
jgi:hypothetical protein